MARAAALLLTADSPICEIVRFAIATACPLALILASRALPF